MNPYVSDEVGERLTLESAHSFEDGVVFARNKSGGVVISIAEEQAVSSFNEEVTCKVTLTREQAVEVRNWLVLNFPPIHNSTG